MSQPYSHVATTVQALVRSGARSAIKFVSPDHVVKVTRRHKRDGRARHVELVLTMGPPNYAERIAVADFLAAGEQFPVKKVQLRFPPKKRK